MRYIDIWILTTINNRINQIMIDDGCKVNKEIRNGFGFRFGFEFGFGVGFGFGFRFGCYLN